MNGGLGGLPHCPPASRREGQGLRCPCPRRPCTRRRGVRKRRNSSARGPELEIDRFGPYGPCETCSESSGSRSREFGGVRVLAGGAVGVRSGGFSRLGALGIGARCVVKSFALREYFRFRVLQFMRRRRGRPEHVRGRPPRFGGSQSRPRPCLASPALPKALGSPLEGNGAAESLLWRLTANSVTPE